MSATARSAALPSASSSATLRPRAARPRRGRRCRASAAAEAAGGGAGGAGAGAAAAEAASAPPGAPTDAAGVLCRIYDCINARDVDGAMALVDDAVLYEDLNFPSPWAGAAGVRKLFEESCEGIPDDLLFVVDDITEGDELKCGVLWHVEIAGVPFPNGRGASFYRIDEESRKLVYARDVVEPPFKPGLAAFAIIRAVAPLVKKTLASSSASSASGEVGTSSSAGATAGGSATPMAALALGAAAVFYTYGLILSPPDQFAPGEPVWMIRPETVKEVTDESINFFFVNMWLQDLGIGLPADAHHPVSEGLFNLVNAYSFMFLPMLLRSERGRGMNTWAWWSVQMFLTNAVMMSYLCKREATLEVRRADPATPAEAPKGGALSKAFGAIGGGMGVLCLWWALFARPEMGGDVAARFDHLSELLATDRVAFAFMADMFIYTAWQYVLIGELDRQREKDSPAWMRLTPFFGLSAWLIAEEP